jgi:serine/threonine protein kinase/Tfp pilus assembly protein PilF
MIGTTISHYEIVEKLGGGGMGVVYKARDLKLERFVALKFLPLELGSDEIEKTRFINEAKTASSLDHPNICTIHEIAETERGQLFIVMTCYEGESLKKKIKHGPLKVEEAVDIALQVARGLAKAHEHGIVHRDIKPANIMLTGDGIIKIVDFGLAKLLALPGLTRTGTTLGTASYMSPEQARGKETDQRTDIWSLGVVVYEMLTGRLPFGGDYESAVIYGILNEEPAPLGLLRSEISADLERAVMKALRKEPEKRYQSMQEMIAALQSPGKEPVRQQPVKHGRRASVYGAVALLLIALGAAGVYFLLPHESAINSVAVLPFANPDADPELEYLCDGLCESLINSLSQLPDLKVKSLNSVMRYKEKPADVQTVAHDLGVGAVLTGKASVRGDQLSIAMELIDAQYNSHLWGVHWYRKTSDLASVQEEMARAVPEGLRMKLSRDESRRLTKRYGTNSEAYQLYLKGRYHWNRRTPDAIEKAIDFFQKALDVEPAYALAYTGLADCFNLLGSFEYSALPPGVAMPKARQAAEKALQFDEGLAEAHVSLGHVKLFFDWDWAGAEREYKRAIALNPNYATAHQWYSDWLLLQDRREETLLEKKKALELDPLSLIQNMDIGTAYYYWRDYDKTIEQCSRTLEMDQSFLLARLLLGRAYVQKRMYKEAIDEFTRVREALPAMTLPATLLGHALGVSGNASQARKILDELLERSKRDYVPSHEIAALYLGLGRNEEALRWFRKAFDEHSGFMVYLKIEPALDPIRSDPRFVELIKKVGMGGVVKGD